MAIVLRGDAPKDGAQAISTALDDLSVFPPSDPLLGGAVLDLSQPIAVYRLGLDAISANKEFLPRAEFMGWRYLMERAGTGDAAYADVRQENETARFVSISRNENAAALIAAAHIAQDVAATLPGDCEFRTIEVPSVKLSAVWLANQIHLFIPYIDGAPNSALSKVVQADDFIHEVTRRASGLPK